MGSSLLEVRRLARGSALGPWRAPTRRVSSMLTFAVNHLQRVAVVRQFGVECQSMQRLPPLEEGLEKAKKGSRAGWLCRALDRSVAGHAGRIVEGGLRHRQQCLSGLVVPVVL